MAKLSAVCAPNRAWFDSNGHSCMVHEKVVWLAAPWKDGWAAADVAQLANAGKRMSQPLRRKYWTDWTPNGLQLQHNREAKRRRSQPERNRVTSELFTQEVTTHGGISAGFFNQALPPQANSLIRAPGSFSDQASGEFHLRCGQNAALKHLAVVTLLRLHVTISSHTVSQSGSNN